MAKASVPGSAPSIPAEKRDPYDPYDYAFDKKQLVLIARDALAELDTKWFSDFDVNRTRGQERTIPKLLITMYAAELEGKVLTKGDACHVMDVDPTTAGRRYLETLVSEGLIEIQNLPGQDKRKDYLLPTAALRRAVEKELRKHGKRMVVTGADLQHLESIKGVTSPDPDLSSFDERFVISAQEVVPAHIGELIATASPKKQKR